MKPVGLIMCCEKKRNYRAQAKDLYIGSEFIRSVAWLQRRTDGWAILSALYGLILPYKIIDPYDVVLRKSEIPLWGKLVRMQIQEHFPGRKFIIIANKLYLSVVEGLPHKRIHSNEIISDK